MKTEATYTAMREIHQEADELHDAMGREFITNGESEKWHEMDRRMCDLVCSLGELRAGTQ